MLLTLVISHTTTVKTTDNYANGVSSGKSNANDKAKDVKDSSESNLTPTGKPYSHGSKTTQDFGKGIIDWIKNPTDSAHNVNSQTEDQFSPWNTVYKHGQNKSISLSNGISNMSSYPISAALALDNGVNDNFNDGIDSANNISDQLGSKKKYKNTLVVDRHQYRHGTTLYIATRFCKRYWWRIAKRHGCNCWRRWPS